MDREKMSQIIKAYLAQTVNCKIEDWDLEGTVFTEHAASTDPYLKMITMGQAVVVSASPWLSSYIQKLLAGRSRDEIFECPHVYGQTIYYTPHLGKIRPIPIPEQYTCRLYKEKEIHTLSGLKDFENSIGFDADGNTPTTIVFCASIGNKIVGVAGASPLQDNLFEVGVDVLPECRHTGLATALVSNLTRELLAEEIIPVYGASTTNIASQAVASACGYTPCWVSSFGTVDDQNYSYHREEIIWKKE